MSGDHKEQDKPLAFSAQPIAFDEEQAFSMEFRKHRHRTCVKCCGCGAAVISILAVTMLVLCFTVFHVKDPQIRMNSVSVEGFSALVDFPDHNHSLKLRFDADVSVKNPNVGSFEFSEATTTIYYGGVVVGEIRHPPGSTRARRSLRMNVTAQLMVERIVEARRLPGDVRSGTVPISSYTEISGRVSILKTVKKDVGIDMNCNMSVNLSSQAIQDQRCSL